MSKLTDVDFYISQLDNILKENGINDIKKNTPNVDNIRDKLKIEIESIINDLETLFEEKERILASPDQKLSVAKKYQNDQKIEENLNNMHTVISKFKQELESYKKKKKNKGEKTYEYYESISKSYDEHYQRFREMKNGKIYEKKDIKKFDKNNLDIILDDSKAAREPEREMYDIEKDKIDQWKSEIKKQDEVLLDVGVDIKKLKVNAKEIGKSIDLNEKMIKKTQNQADKTDVELKRSNKQLKDILEKVGGPTNFCVDVVLVCVCLGLCAVLYNILKSRK